MGATKDCKDCNGKHTMKLYHDTEESPFNVAMLDVWRCFDCGRVEVDYKLISIEDNTVKDQHCIVKGIGKE